MGDEEGGPQCKVVYTDVDPEEETNRIKRAGAARVSYVNGDSFVGTFDAEKNKQGSGVYVWVKPGEEEGSFVEKARYEGSWKDNQKHGVGKMTFPNGDTFEGEWFENKIQGEGTYVYKKTDDMYSGSWVDGKKHGKGRYEYAADRSILLGQWEAGQITTGKWELKGAAVYDGEFKLGRPFGPGQFTFESGLTQSGTYTVIKQPGEEEEAPAEGEAPKPPNVTWLGDNIVSFV